MYLLISFYWYPSFYHRPTTHSWGVLGKSYENFFFRLKIWLPEYIKQKCRTNLLITEFNTCLWGLLLTITATVIWFYFSKTETKYIMRYIIHIWNIYFQLYKTLFILVTNGIAIKIVLPLDGDYCIVGSRYLRCERSISQWVIQKW